MKEVKIDGIKLLLHLEMYWVSSIIYAFIFLNILDKWGDLFLIYFWLAMICIEYIVK